MDYVALQRKLFEMAPSDPVEDLRKIASMAEVGGTVQELNEFEQDGSPMEEILPNAPVAPVASVVETSIADFAKLAGVKLNEAGAADAFKAGYKNYNKPDAIKQAANAMGSGSKATGIATATGSPKSKSKSNVKVSSSVYSSFLKKHTAQLQKIAADPKKSADFDKFMTSVEEARSSASDQAAKAGAYNGGKSLAGKQHGKADLAHKLKGDALQKHRDASVAKMRDEDEAAKKANRDRLSASLKNKMNPIKRNPVASHAQSSGSGTHQDQHNKNKPDRKQKHKKPIQADESIKSQLWAALNSK